MTTSPASPALDTRPTVLTGFAALPEFVIVDDRAPRTHGGVVVDLGNEVTYRAIAADGSPTFTDGHVDAKGRQVGHRVYIERQVRWIHPTPGTPFRGEFSADQYVVVFVARLMSVRDGKPFGAYASGTDYPTFAEAVKGAGRALAAAKKRVARDAAKGVGRQWAPRGLGARGAPSGAPLSLRRDPLFSRGSHFSSGGSKKRP